LPAQRSPEQIQAEIEAAREHLAVTLDELADRTSPKRLAGEAKNSLIARAKTPAGIAVLTGVGALITLVVIRRFRSR
jgi:hypothetical protein